MPDFRWRGEMPTPGVRASILNAVQATDAVDGVATLRIYDPIDSWGGEWGVSAKEFAAALDGLPDGVTEIRLHLNSPGGEVWEALAITNLLREHPARVVAVVDGLAASAASFIACSADDVVMGRNSQLMIHDGRGLCMGTAGDMRGLADLLDKISDNIASIYTAKAGSTVRHWRDMMLAETWFDAAEAVAAGLADRVAGDDLPDEAPTAAFDLSGFKFQGREAAPAPVVAVADVEPEPTNGPDVDAARLRLNLRKKPRRG